jgi:hypothetical protein
MGASKLSFVVGVSSFGRSVICLAVTLLGQYHDVDSTSGQMLGDLRIDVDALDMVKEVEDVAKSFVAPGTNGLLV